MDHFHVGVYNFVLSMPCTMVMFTPKVINFVLGPIFGPKLLPLNCLPVHIAGQHQLIVAGVKVEDAVLRQTLEYGDVLEGDHISHVPAVPGLRDVGMPQLLEPLLLPRLHPHHLNVQYIARVTGHQVQVKVLIRWLGH